MLDDHVPKIETFPRQIGAHEAIVGVDLQLESLAPDPQMPWVNSLRVVAQVDQDGREPVELFPAEEGPIIDQQIFVPLADDRRQQAVLVGSVATLSSAEWFVYSAEPCAETLGEAVAAEFGHLQVGARAQQDPTWSVYREFLCPSQLERRLIQNRRQIGQLDVVDDIDSQALPVDHTLWFVSKDDRNRFGETVVDEGFELHYPDQEFELDIGQADPEYGLTISRIDTVAVDTLDELVRWLFKQAAQIGGEYEGWRVQING